MTEPEQPTTRVITVAEQVVTSDDTAPSTVRDAPTVTSSSKPSNRDASIVESGLHIGVTGHVHGAQQQSIIPQDVNAASTSSSTTSALQVPVPAPHLIDSTAPPTPVIGRSQTVHKAQQSAPRHAAAGDQPAGSDADMDELASDLGDDAASIDSHAYSTRSHNLTATRFSTPVASSVANSSPRSTASGRIARRRPTTTHPVPPLPHYTIIYAANNSRASPHRIKVNQGVTDADESLWPSPASRQRGFKQGGKLSWYDCQPANQGKHAKWLEGLGKELASLLKLDTPRAGGRQDHWILDGWPDHYLFTVHHTPAKVEGGPDRQDAYLFGSPSTSKFRTVNEFTPHMYWLLMHGPDDDLQCECKYCTRKTQAQVNAVVGLTNPATLTFNKRERASSSTSHLSPRPKKQQHRDSEFGGREATSSASDLLPGFNPGDYVRDRPKRRTASAANGFDWSMLALGDSGPGPEASTSARKLTNAKQTPKDPDPAVDKPSYRGAFTNKQRDQDLGEKCLYRRGELVMVELENGFKDSENKRFAITHWPAVVRERNLVSRSMTIPGKHLSVMPQIINQQSYQYKVELLATSDCVTRPETALRPWLSNSPFDPAIFSDREALFNEVGISNVWNMEANSFRRPALSSLETPLGAITALALALQIGAALRSSFTLDNKYLINREHLVPLVGTTMTEQEHADMLDSLKSWHFQQLWWGAELIWSGELVRLITTDEFWTPEIQPSGQANDRAHFLKISAIWKHHSRADQAQVAMLSGHVYELREVKDEQPAVEGKDASDSKGKGKAPLLTKAKKKKKLPIYMPRPPAGYEFVRLSKHEMHVDASFIAGRYYPLPAHVDSPHAQQAALEGGWWRAESEGSATATQSWTRSLEQHSVVLAGLTPALVAYMNPTTWNVGRYEAMVDAELKAVSDFCSAWNADQDTDEARTGEASGVESDQVARVDTVARVPVLAT